MCFPPTHVTYASIDKLGNTNKTILPHESQHRSLLLQSTRSPPCPMLTWSEAGCCKTARVSGNILEPFGLMA